MSLYTICGSQTIRTSAAVVCGMKCSLTLFSVVLNCTVYRPSYQLLSDKHHLLRQIRYSLTVVVTLLIF